MVSITVCDDNTVILDVEFEFEITSSGGGGKYPDYKGSYEITPSLEEQMLKTKNRSMNKDVTVNPIPTYEVSNDSGTTFIIGGTI